MNKNLLKYSILFLQASMIFTACQKQELLQSENQNTQDEVNTDDAIEKKIIAFKAKVENGVKSGETMTVKEAVWNIEAALNYTYCIVSEEDAKSGANLATTVSMETANNYSGGNISIQEITSIYNDMKNAMNTEFERLNSSVKFYTIANVKYENNAFILKSELRHISSDKGPIGFYVINYDWEWGGGLGRCDGTYQGQDLTTEIEKWVRRNRPILGNVYYTNVEWEGWFVSYNPILPHHSDWTNLAPYGANMFYVEDPVGGAHYCVSATQGEYHASETNQALSVIEQYIADPGRKVTDWYISVCSETNNYTTKGHVIGVNTGEVHIAPPIR